MTDMNSDLPPEVLNPPAQIVTTEEKGRSPVPAELQKYILNPPCHENDFEMEKDTDSSCQRKDWVDAQLEALEGQAIDNPAGHCIRAIDLEKVLKGDPSHAHTKFSNRQAWLIDVLKSPYGASSLMRKFVAAAAYNSVLVCNFHDKSTGRSDENFGVFDPALNVISINQTGIETRIMSSGKMPGSLDPKFWLIPLDEAREIVAPDSRNMAGIVVREEFAHAYQALVQGEGVVRGLKEPALRDAVLWNLSLEAHAKLSYIVDFLKTYDAALKSEDTEKIQYHGGVFDQFSLRYAGGEKDMMLYLMSEAAEKGGSALSDPDTLYTAFTLFFKNEDSMLSYFDEEAMAVLEEDPSAQRIEVRKFVKIFGVLTGDEFSGTNFLKERLKSPDDLMNLIPKEYPVRQWLDQHEPPAVRGRGAAVVLSRAECLEELKKGSSMEGFICVPE
ncbi:MAG: hypothetical protein H6855_05615 [Rhodospirillales bacterium]|nr:hypothetical protein [Rhodospirillales bacterium]